MSALRKFIVHSLISIFILLPITYYQLPITYAQDSTEEQPAENTSEPEEAQPENTATEEENPEEPEPEPTSEEAEDTSISASSSAKEAPISNIDGTPITKGNYGPHQNADYLLLNIQGGLLCHLIFFSPAGGCTGLKINPDGTTSMYLYTNTDKNLAVGGAVGGLTNLISSVYTNPPTSSAYYVANLFENMGLAPKTAYAQVTGSGAGIIQPVESLWKVSRNLAYLAFILVFIVVGFMVMFRRKIDPHTVISVQQALPGLVLGIILVTFSYFIAALLIDISFLSIQLVAQFFIQSGSQNVFSDIQNMANNSNIFQMFVSSIRLPENFADFTGGIYRTIFSAGGGGAGTAATVLIPIIIGAIIGAVLGPFGIPAGAALGAGVATAAPAIVGLLLVLVLVIALLIQFFRLLWQLVSAYISLLLATIFGPLFITFASIPGRGGALGWWWKTLLANSLIFPAVFAAFLFAGMVLGLPTESFNAQPPLFGGLSVELLRLILAYGIILGTPVIPSMVKGVFGVRGVEGLAAAALAGAEGGAEAYRAGARLGLTEAGHAREAYLRYKTTGDDTGWMAFSPKMRGIVRNPLVGGVIDRLRGGH